MKSVRRFRLLLIPAAAIALAAAINFLWIVNARVPSGSMSPTVPEGAMVIGMRTAYRTHDPERGDIVFFYHKEISDHLLLKRIVALPGDSYELREGIAYLNGQAVDEPYLTERSGDDFGPVTVPENCYLMLGDNRNASTDARYWADPFVPRTDIVAQAQFCYFPQFRNLKE